MSLGCVDEQPQKVETTQPPQTTIAPTTEAPQVQPTTTPPPTTEAPKPTVQTFEVGESATDGKVSITVNSARATRVIDENDNRFMVSDAPVGRKYLIVDITVENLQDDMTVSNSTSRMSLYDGEDYKYDSSWSATSNLAQEFKGSDILPEMKRRGQVAFDVPENASGIQFAYLFDTGMTAVINIPDNMTSVPKVAKKVSFTITNVESSWYGYDLGGTIGSISYTIKNTGTVSIKPTFDIIISTSGGAIIHTKKGSSGYETLSPGKSKPDKILQWGDIESSGSYTVKVDVRDGKETEILATGSKTITVS